MHEKRRKIWIDRFQTLLCWRIACYFVFYQMAVWLLVGIAAVVRNGVTEVVGADLASAVMWAALGVVFVVGVLFIYDAIKFSHRVVGPLVRFRHVCQAVRDGEPVPLVRLRKDDLLGDFRDEFNEMLKALAERGAIVLQTADENAEGANRVEAAASV